MAAVVHAPLVQRHGGRYWPRKWCIYVVNVTTFVRRDTVQLFQHIGSSRPCYESVCLCLHALVFVVRVTAAPTRAAALLLPVLILLVRVPLLLLLMVVLLLLVLAHSLLLLLPLALLRHFFATVVPLPVQLPTTRALTDTL